MRKESEMEQAVRARVEHLVDEGVPLEVVWLEIELSDLGREEKDWLGTWAWAWWMSRPRRLTERLAALWSRPRLKLR